MDCGDRGCAGALRGAPAEVPNHLKDKHYLEFLYLYKKRIKKIIVGPYKMCDRLTFDVCCAINEYLRY